MKQLINEENKDGKAFHKKTIKQIEEELAKEFGVTTRTVRNAGKYSRAVDIIVKNTDLRLNDLWSGRVKSTQKDIKELAKQTPEFQRQVIDLLLKGE